MTSLLILVLPLVLAQETNPACTRPSGWCTHSGATYSFEDCDGDGILDPVCRDTGGNVGVLSSGNHCIDSWPTGTCLAPASATYVQCGYLGSPHGGSSGHCKTNAASPSIDWCRNYMRSHTSAIAFNWAELYSSNLGHCFIYFDSSVTACPSGVTWYQNYFLGMTSTFVRDGSCGSGEATYYYEYLQELVQVGNEPEDRGMSDTGSGMQFVSEYRIEETGKLTLWEFWAFLEDTMILQVYRQQDNPLTYNLVGMTTFDASVGYNEVEANIDVQAGDVLGWYCSGVQPIEYDNGGGRTVRRRYGYTGTDAQISVTNHEEGWEREYSIRATIHVAESTEAALEDCVDFDIMTHPDGYPEEMSWGLVGFNRCGLLQGELTINDGVFTTTCCVPTGTQITIRCGDGYGDGWEYEGVQGYLSIDGQTYCDNFNSGYSVEAYWIVESPPTEAPQYEFVEDGTCESHGFFSIHDQADCQAAGADAGKIAAVQLKDDQSWGTGRPTGCSWHNSGNLEQWADSQGDCNVHGYAGCFCKSSIPRVVSGMCDLPRGNYEDSCHSCRVENCVLKCLCGMGQTTLDLKRRCRGQEVINLGGALACPISKQGSDLLDLYFPQGEAQEPIGFQDECVPEDLVRSSIETSQCVTKTNVFKPTSVETESVFNGFLWSFGQFVDHDLDLVAENHTAEVYSESHFFELAVSNCDEEDMVGNRINVVSSAFDLSSVYNDAKPEIRSQVDPAFLAMHDIDELPIDDKGNYICGDDRCNENPFLTAQHTLWAKHHNIIVEELNYALSVEETQDRDAVYEKAKQINIATYQKVIMEEFVPTLVGNLDGEYAYQGHMHSYEIMEANKQCRSGTWLPLGDTKVTPKLCMHLITSLAHNGQCHGGYMSTSTTTGGCFCVTSDDCDMEPAPGIDTYRVGPQHDMSISPLFAGAAYRLHQLVQDTFELAPGQIDALSSHFMKPKSFQQWGKLDGWVNRLLQTKSNKFGSHMSHSLKHALFCTDPDAECQNLAARNCMRGRDFDLPTLNEARELFGLPPYDSFDALLENCPELPTLYDWQIDDVELFIGGSCEDPVSGAVLGETFLQIVRDQFVRLRDGDRTYGGTDHPIEGGIYRNLRQVLETVTGSDQSSFHRSNIFLFEDAATTAPFDGRI